jgi:excisionase family DNA binding protein
MKKNLKCVETIRPAFVDKAGAADYIGMSKRHLDRVKAAGDLPFYRVGQKVIFAIVDLNHYMQRFRVDVGAALAGVA